MSKSYKMEDLECANCARKTEDAIRKIDGVASAYVSFPMQKLTVETTDVGDIAEVLRLVVKACKRVEPDCRILGV